MKSNLLKRVTPDAFRKFGSSISDTLIDIAMQAQQKDLPVTAADKNIITLAVPSFMGIEDYCCKIKALRECKNIEAVSFSTQEDPANFDEKPVWIMQVEVDECCNANAISETLKLLFWSSNNDLFAEYLVAPGKITFAEANLLRAAAEFVHTQCAFIDRSAYNLYDIYRYIAINIDTVKLLLEFFNGKFAPGNTGKTDLQNLLDMVDSGIEQLNSGVYYNDVIAKNILRAVKNFFMSIAKSNYYSADKAALAFRLDPAFMDFYASVNQAYNQAFPSDRPYGVFFFFRENAVGFQVRFSDIARGGWRTVVPKRNPNKLEEMALYDAANDEIFREVFVLAHTQHLKNKDIYEGGSKMIMLLNMAQGADFKASLWTAQRAICEAFVSLINYDENDLLRDKNIIDRLGRKEIIEIGPDENMFDDMICWIGQYAEKVGYTLKSGLISGKPDSGINHKEYGVTSFGVYQYLLRTMQELNIAPDADFSVKIAGGPGGDVAGNMMKLLLAKKSDGSPVHPNLKITAITDGPAVIFDPAGIDRDELSSLVLKANLDAFDPAKLKGIGAYMLFSKPDDNGSYKLVECIDEVISEKRVDRNEYMRIFQNNLYNYADIFMPCGGRPSTLNLNNYLDYLPNGVPSSKAIVEGANSFITPEARIKLQDAGIPIIKDASANKCGVITSSYEILSGLMLDTAEFQAETDIIVQEVLARLAHLAQIEADWLFKMHKKSGKYLTLLTEELSQAINTENARIAAVLSSDPAQCNPATILKHLPNVLATRYAERIERLPREYKIAIASVEQATGKIYSSAI